MSYPYQVKDFDEMARKLCLGEWLVLRHEHLCGIDLDIWKEGVDRACAALGIDVMMQDIPHKDLTVVFNTAREMVPRIEQIHDSIRRIERYRWLDRLTG
ncbi:hypothetical protein ACFWY9_26505 [Amycolatopsis sp. NPDC059027]|uniref:hypothetical protein n=1 Tax=unclassified Amycolatopsis TaxID=2618356 RepID=UPI0036711424